MRRASVTGPFHWRQRTASFSGNATGIQVSGTNSTAYVSDSTITRNTTGVNPAAAGTIVSGDDNRLVNNVADGAFSSTVPKI